MNKPRESRNRNRHFVVKSFLIHSYTVKSKIYTQSLCFTPDQPYFILSSFTPFTYHRTLPSNPASLTSLKNKPRLSTNSLGLPNSTTRPASNTTIRSLSRIVLMRCAIVMIVLLLKSGERSVVWSRASVSTSTAAVASSRTRMLEGVRRARARETSWRWPCERLDPLGDVVSREVR